MPDPVVRVEGVRQLRTALRRADGDLSDFRQANAEAAAIASSASGTRVPRRTGRLAASIRPGATQTQAIVRAGGSSVPYAQVIHWGWPARHIRPQPFITDGAQASEPAWFPAYVKALDRILARIERTAHP